MPPQLKRGCEKEVCKVPAITHPTKGGDRNFMLNSARLNLQQPSEKWYMGAVVCVGEGKQIVGEGTK